MAKTRIVLNDQSDLILNNAQIVEPTGIVKSDLPGLVDDLSALSTADSTEASLRQAADTAEESSRKAGDQALQANIDTLESQHNDEMSVETSARIAGDEAEASRAAAAEAAIQSELDALEVEHAADTATLQGNIDAEASRAQAAEAVIVDAVNKEQSNRVVAVDSLRTVVNDADASIASDLADEATDRKAADDALQANIDAEKARINAILEASTADADSFAEIVALINSVDTTNDQAFAAYVLANDAALSAEVSRRIAGDSTLTADLSSEVVRATAAEASLGTALANEESNRTAADEVHTAAISTEIVNRTAGDAALQANLNNEISDRIAGDQLVDGKLSSETSRAVAAETSLSTDLTAEVSNRIADVDAEETRAMAAEASLGTAMAAADSVEKAAREAADASIDAAYKAADSAMDAAYKAADSVEKAAREAADSSLETSINGVDTKVSDLETSTDTAVASLETAIADEHQHHIDGDAAVTAAYKAADAVIDAAYKAADSVEKAAREAADASLAVAYKAADDVLQSNIDVEKGRIDAILDGSTVDLDQFAEVVAFVQGIDLENDNALLSAITDINTAISNEASTRFFEDSKIDGLVRYETSRAESAEISLNAKIEEKSWTLEEMISGNTVNLNQEIVDRLTGDESLAAQISDLVVADASLETMVNDIISNTDITALDSFTEMETAINYANEDNLINSLDYTVSLVPGFQNAYVADGVNKLFAFTVVESSMIVFLNGLMQKKGVDYRITAKNEVEFNEAPKNLGTIDIYGVDNSAYTAQPTSVLLADYLGLAPAPVGGGK